MRSYKIDPEKGCWIWQGTKHKSGYGWIKAFGKVVSAHRLSYELHRGPIPNGMHILHSCDVKDCVNPDHLHVGTHAQNMAEAFERNRMAAHIARLSNPVIVLGKRYESQNAAERALGLGSGTVRYWIRNHPKKAILIERK